jgi:hypothetical protein
MTRAIDTSGNVSEVAQRRTTVEFLPNVNIIEEVDDRRYIWPGVRKNFDVRVDPKVKLMSEWLKLSDVYYLDEVGAGVGDLISTGSFGNVAPSSEYYFKDYVDQGNIYESRVSSLLEAHGEYESGESAPTSSWDAWIEVRITATMNFISSWDTLASRDTMNVPGESEWSDWRPMIVGDITARLLQFRIQARSYDPFVKVVVTQGSVTVDAVDRTWQKNNIKLTKGRQTIYVDEPFMFDDISVAISIDGDEIPLIAKVTNKRRSSFDVELRNAYSNVLEDGQIDAIVRGQGREKLQQI